MGVNLFSDDQNQHRFRDLARAFQGKAFKNKRGLGFCLGGFVCSGFLLVVVVGFLWVFFVSFV